LVRTSGADDKTIYQACCRERRCLVTLDLDFADPIRFQSGDCSGIVVIRLPHSASARLVKILASETAAALGRMPLDNGLWIVEPGRIRVHHKAED
jgi:predicted nuclease of predicted toxin-antitoxin system